jgi:PAS domain S-box-containing protein
VVEDEIIIARDIEATLNDLGYIVGPPVATGEEALQAVESRSPDLVLMDIRLQGDTDGIQTAAGIRDRYGTPVVFLTSHSDEDTLARATPTGAYGYVLKPFNERDLRTAIEVALQKRVIERHLSERERWFATTLKSVGDAVIATDFNERITFMNRVAERITGFDAPEAEGKLLSEVLRLVDPTTGATVESPLSRAFRDGFAVELPAGTSLSARDGQARLVDDSAAPIVDDSGKTLGGVVVFRDVTERRKMEQRLMRNERLAAIGTLSAGMAHEINNPLAYVLANVTYAVEALKDMEPRVAAIPGSAVGALSSQLGEVGDALAQALEGTMRVRRIVQDLKKFGRLDAAEPGIVDVPVVLETAIRLTENVLRHHAQVRREYRTTPFVTANEGQLVQVFVNLLVNAGQALETRPNGENLVVIATYTDDAGRAVAEVRDSGPGIAADVQGKVFDPFFTTKAVGGGSGLGLSVAHSIVASLGGDISLASELGRGATFRVVLPAAEATARKTAMASAAPAPVRRGRVLLIDDEPAIGKAITRLLQRDHDVVFLADAREALASIAKGDGYDVVFCDLMMPVMNGMEFFEAVRERAPDLARRIVFLSGGAFTAATEAFLQSTSNVSVSKPVDPTTLRKIVVDYACGPA